MIRHSVPLETAVPFLALASSYGRKELRRNSILERRCLTVDVKTL